MENNLPLVSVVLPVYNHERFVREALDSVFRQSYPHLALVVVDDGSEDESPAIVAEHLEKSPHPYQFLQQDNQGAHAALNTAIERSEGQYIAILNSDDLYHPERVDRVVRRLRECPARFAYSRVRHIDGEGRALSADHPLHFYYWRSLEDLKKFPTPSFELLRHNFAVSSGNFVFNRDLYQEMGPFKAYVTCHDWDYLLRVILQEEPLFVDEALYGYRVHSQNTLRRREDLRGREIDQVISTYLRDMDGAQNPLAPTPGNWGGYWTFFQNRYLGHFREYERAGKILEERSPDVDPHFRLWGGVERLNRALDRVSKFRRKVGTGMRSAGHSAKARFLRGLVKLLTRLARVWEAF